MKMKLFGGPRDGDTVDVDADLTRDLEPVIVAAKTSWQHPPPDPVPRKEYVYEPTPVCRGDVYRLALICEHDDYEDHAEHIESEWEDLPLRASSHSTGTAT